MGYYVVITTNEEQFEFVKFNGIIKEFHVLAEALDYFERTIEKHGSFNVELLEAVTIRVKTDVEIINKAVINNV